MKRTTGSPSRNDLMRRNIAVITDSCADIPPDLVKQYGIYILPLQIRCSEGVFVTVWTSIPRMSTGFRKRKCSVPASRSAATLNNC